MSGERARPMILDPTPWLETTAIARVLELHGTIGSTNDRARKLARAGAAHGTTIVARAQTAGRGQRGRTWHSPEGTGLYVSFIVRPKLPPRQAPTLTLMTGVALHDALLEALGAPTMIKWPNDLLATTPTLRGRKVAGILVEVSADPQTLDHAVIGVGLNVLDTERPPELARYATTVEAILAANGSGATDAATLATTGMARLLAVLARELERRLDEASRFGFGPVLDAWARHAAGRDELVELDVDGAKTTGLLRGVAEDGALLLDGPGGTRRIYRGELHIPGAPRRPAQNV
ncbi:biotin--[acetyl-CoA-carboxylase] ligase [Myxococcota bacterium]|nr:biotin--[acetyl-CoA-carboxylase] ligase [Myxococcota bacterium]